MSPEDTSFRWANVTPGELMQEWADLPRQILPQFRGFIARIGYEDAWGIAQVALCEAAYAWDETHNVPFRAFAHERIRFALMEEYYTGHVIRRKARKAHSPAPEVQLFSQAPPGQDATVFAGRLDPSFNHADTCDELARILAWLPSREADILYRVIGLGENMRDVARELGLSYSRIWQLREQAMQELRERAAA